MKRLKKSKVGYKKTEEYGRVDYGYQGKPEGDSNPNIGISVKALRDLPKSSYSVQADPYTAALPGSEPYAVLNRFNKTIGGFYGGLRNIDGGNVQQYANSVNSKFLKYADFMRLKLGINYHYIPVKGVSQISGGHYPGKALIDEQLRAINEAISTLQSTTFTQMAIYNYAVITDMPMGTSYDHAITDYTLDGEVISNGNPAYTRLGDVIYAALRYYQIFLLKVLGVFDWHNSFRLKMGTMIRSSWNRETPALNSLFGLFKKKSFLALLNSMALSLPGEYLDREFALQFAKTCLVPSRRANALTEPLLETQVEYNSPDNFILALRVDTNKFETIYNKKISELKYTSAFPKTTDGGGKTFDDAVSEVMDYLSAEDTMKWARNNNSDETLPNDNARFNAVKNRLDVIQLCMTTFKSQFADVREVLDTVQRAGLVTWYKGFRPSITRDDTADLFRNLIVDDIYRLAMNGPTQVSLDIDTKRWKSFSFWNMYDGIPEYDAFSGGAFLTFSLKEVVTNSDPDFIQDYLPQCLTKWRVSEDLTVKAVTRQGTEYDLTTVDVTMNEQLSLRRLVPLSSQSSLQTRIVQIQYPSGATNKQADEISCLIRTVTQVMGMVQLNTNGTPTYMDPDVLSVYQIEIEDITNEMIAYARKTGPFRGAVAAESKIGFLGTVAAGNKSTLLDEKMGG